MKACSSCHRHMRRAEHSCPFCGAPVRDTTAPLVAVLSLASTLVGCIDPPPAETTGSTPATDTGHADTTGVSSLSGSGPIEMSTTAVDSDDSATDTTSGVGFIYGDPDGGTPHLECDIFQQDCPEGDKCMPWANDGGGTWNATRCSPIAENPGQPGDSCTVEGSGVSGQDDCDIAVMCWNVDTETDTGTCVAMCTGDEANPICESPDTTCSITNDGVLALCLPTCDPLLQDCEEDTACYPLDGEFVCAPDSSAEMGAYGDPCEYINMCDPGLMCGSPDIVPNCVASLGCCTEFCSLGDPAGDAQCTGEPQGQQCQAFYEEGMAPPQHADVGVCALPI